MTAAWAPAPPPRIAKTDLYAAAAVFVVGWAIAVVYLPSFRSAGGVQQFYQEEYGPAVMAACGRGFVNPDLHSTRILDAFLNNRVQTFDCRSLPASVAVIQFDVLQGITRYLLVAAGVIWRIRGSQAGPFHPNRPTLPPCAVQRDLVCLAGCASKSMLRRDRRRGHVVLAAVPGHPARTASGLP